MPNTLCHIAIQAPLCRRFLSPIELTWVVIGCLIPDLPWIWLKLLLGANLFNPYDLRLYCTAQASLLFCVVLAGAFSMLAPKSFRVFLIITVNCTFHLALDALQIKWGNGVNFLAPFDWRMVRFDLFWPEHLLTMGLTVFGLGYILYLLFKGQAIAGMKPGSSSGLHLINPYKIIGGALLVIIYVTGPLLFMVDMEQADTYFIGTMRHTKERPGKQIEFDRADYDAESGEIQIYSGERLKVAGPQPDSSGRVSFKGRFISTDTLLSSQYHYHRDFRDTASIVGLFLACALLLQSLISWKQSTR